MLRLAKLALLAALGVSLACGTSEPAVVRIDEMSRAVEFEATVNASGFSEGEMAGYHLIVHDNGGSAEGALLLAAVTDVAVLDALESLGAVAGDALDLETWDHRHDPDSWKPDRVIEGPLVEISVRLPGAQDWRGLSEIVEDRAGVGFEMRFGGHRQNIPAWHSGCVACLYSCPGSKLGNARSTVRDFADGLVLFRLREGVLPADGTEVEVRLQLVG